MVIKLWKVTHQVMEMSWTAFVVGVTSLDYRLPGDSPPKTARKIDFWRKKNLVTF